MPLRPAVGRLLTSDIYPTIVDLLHIKLPNQNLPLDGVSLMPLIDGRMKERPQPIGFWARGGSAAWTDNRYKLHQLPGGRYELYDIAADISQKTRDCRRAPGDRSADESGAGGLAAVGAAQQPRRGLPRKESVYVEDLFGRMRSYQHRFMLSASCNTSIRTPWRVIQWFRDAWREFAQ